MELLLLIVLVVGFATNILFMRFFFKRISDKVTFSSGIEEEKNGAYIPHNNPLMNNLFRPSHASTAYSPPIEKPAPNQIGEENLDLELSEQNFSGLPKDVKFAVEGGDTHIPPGFEGIGK